MPLRMDSRITLILGLALAACVSTGCAMLQPKPTTELTAEVKSNGTDGSKVETPPGTFTVEVRPAKGKPIAKEQPLAGPLTVQEALEHTRANKKYKRFNLQLHRPLPDGRIHSMVLEYDRAAKMVDPEYDYTIQAGDRVIVIEDPTTILDDVMKQISIPFGGPSRFTGKDKQKTKYRFEG
jgi:hypothetical protein